MPIDESDTVRAARDRLDANRDGKTDLADIQAHAGGIRSKIIDLFEIILWVSLVLGILGSIGALFSGAFFGAISAFVGTIVSVGVGFVVLDIRERLMGRH